MGATTTMTTNKKKVGPPPTTAATRGKREFSATPSTSLGETTSLSGISSGGSSPRIDDDEIDDAVDDDDVNTTSDKIDLVLWTQQQQRWWRSWVCRFIVIVALITFAALAVAITFVIQNNLLRPTSSNNSSSSSLNGGGGGDTSSDTAPSPVAVAPQAPLSSNDVGAGQTENEDEYVNSVVNGVNVTVVKRPHHPTTKTPTKAPTTPIPSAISLPPKTAAPIVEPPITTTASPATESPITESPIATTASPTMKPTTFGPLRIDVGYFSYSEVAGALDYIDSKSNRWVPDISYTNTGTTYSVDSCPKTGLTFPLTINQQLYCSGRRDMTSFNIPIPNGVYTVILHLYQPPDEVTNEYDVYFERMLVYRELGSTVDDVERPMYYTFQADTEVKDTSLTIGFVKRIGSPMVAAIEIHPVADAASARENIPTTNVTYIPGLLTVQQEGLILSEGLKATLIARSGRRVQYGNGDLSHHAFHVMPDAGATYIDRRSSNVGGWIYVSNSEADPKKLDGDDPFPGGVGAITFNAQGQIIDYRMVLNNTRQNCGGGRTPWDTWVSCEEYEAGQIYQVDPSGVRPGEIITMGKAFPGKFESFAYDTRIRGMPRFFVTKDDDNGEVRRFTAKNPDWSNPWSILTGEGTLDYLVLVPGDTNTSGTYKWDPDQSLGAASAAKLFPGSEGIDVRDDKLYFIAKEVKTMYILDLDGNTYEGFSTHNGLFDGQPDQIQRLVKNDEAADAVLYFTEDGGTYAGVHGRNRAGQFLTILESHEYPDETTGLSFSPDSKHMYIAYQDNGFLFDIQRTDGLPFNARTLNVKYHNVAMQ